MSTYQISTPSGRSFSVIAGDSDMAVMAAGAEAKRQGIESARANLHLDGIRLGEFDLAGCPSKQDKPKGRAKKSFFDTSSFSTVGWHSYNDAGVPSGYSKRHLVDEGGHRTLCGQTIPSASDREVFDGDVHCDDCKACGRAAARNIPS